MANKKLSILALMLGLACGINTIAMKPKKIIDKGIKEFSKQVYENKEFSPNPDQMKKYLKAVKILKYSEILYFR